MDLCQSAKPHPLAPALLERLSSATRGKRGEEGLSLVYVLIAALVLIAGTATLLNRTTSSLLGSTFQAQSLSARDAARIGMSYLISEINKERNRHLLAALDSQVDASSNAERTIWTDSTASQFHRNPCLTGRDALGNRIDPPIPALNNLNIGSTATNQGFLYIQPDGTVTQTKGNATRAFRIFTDDQSNNFRIARKTNLFLLDDERTRGSFRLSVEGITYRGNTNSIESRAILQEDFAIIPKCCKVPFGGFTDPNTGQLRGHGTNSYEITDKSNLSSNSCMLPGLNPNGFGIVVGAGGNGGSINANGNPTIQDPNGIAINPVYCVSSSSTQCTAADNGSKNIMERIDVELPPPPLYPGSWNPNTIPPTLVACTSAANCPSSVGSKAGVDQLTYYNSTEKATIFNAVGVSPGNLPSNCTIYREDIHCIYGGFDVGNNLIVFVTGATSRQVRLYFPRQGYVIKQTGNGKFDHCKISPTGVANGQCQKPTNITDLSIFGCSLERQDPGCGAQSLDITGSVNGAGFYIFAPEATINLKGTAAFQGVMWVKTVNMTGTTAVPTVPTSGVADVFVLMGILPGDGNNYDKSLTGEPTTTDLFAWDMVARSTNRFRFFGRETD
jgi:hypothetical protein